MKIYFDFSNHFQFILSHIEVNQAIGLTCDFFIGEECITRPYVRQE